MNDLRHRFAVGCPAVLLSRDQDPQRQDHDVVPASCEFEGISDVHGARWPTVVGKDLEAVHLCSSAPLLLEYIANDVSEARTMSVRVLPCTIHEVSLAPGAQIPSINHHNFQHV